VLEKQAVHPHSLLLFSQRQYGTREASNLSAKSNQQFVPEPFKEDAVVAWSAGWSLSSSCLRYLPTGYCFYGHRDPGHEFTLCDSNGNAAGSTLEEAIVQGFLELAERDAVAIWWYNRIRRPPVDVSSFGLSFWERMSSYYRTELHRDLHVLDITSDLGIPTFAVVSRRLDRTAEDIIVGFSAHLDPRTAIERALVEANQYLPAISLERPDGSTRYHAMNAPEAVHWWKTATYANQPYLLPLENVPSKKLQEFRSLASDDLFDDVQTCLEIAAARKLEVIVVDQTRPDIGLNVVKVVVPGLRHFWRRLAPGRLFEVPLELGWIEAPLAEEQLNPIACFV
jgi:ribosomal protein S12 methylthiotransferase accessory factor